MFGAEIKYMVAKTLFILFLLHICGQHNGHKRQSSSQTIAKRCNVYMYLHSDSDSWRCSAWLSPAETTHNASSRFSYLFSSQYSYLQQRYWRNYQRHSSSLLLYLHVNVRAVSCSQSADRNFSAITVQIFNYLPLNGRQQKKCIQHIGRPKAKYSE